VVVIFTKTALPSGVIDVILQRPIDSAKLNYVASVLQKNRAGDKDACLLMSRQFIAAAD
jgi:hypothetical protein